MPANLRVLHFYKRYLPESIGGVESVIYELATHLPLIDVKVDVLSLSTNIDNKKVNLLNHVAYKAKEDFHFASTGFSISVILRFMQLAKGADIIHYHYPWPFMDLIHIFLRVKKPTVVTYHSDIVRQKWLKTLYAPLRYLFLKKVNAVVATSPNYLSTSRILKKLGSKVCVIPLGIDKRGYPSASQYCKCKWKDLVGNKFFLFVGVLRYYKGLHTLLEALKIREYPVVIIGTGPMEYELKARCSELGLKSVTFLGYVSHNDKCALLELCYGVLFPSHLRSEAFGVSLLEGAMFGKPLISCEIGTGTSYVNVNGLTGIVVPPADPKKFSEAMSTLWEDENLAHNYGLSAKDRFQNLFTSDLMAKRYKAMYNHIVFD